MKFIASPTIKEISVQVYEPRHNLERCQKSHEEGSHGPRSRRLGKGRSLASGDSLLLRSENTILFFVTTMVQDLSEERLNSRRPSSYVFIMGAYIRYSRA